MARVAIRSMDDRVLPRVAVLSDRGPLAERLTRHGIEVAALGAHSGLGMPGALSSLTRLIRDFQPDIVQSWMYHADLAAGLAARWAGSVPVVWNIRNTDVRSGAGLSRSTWWVMKACALLSRRLPVAIICNSERGRLEHARLGYDPLRIKVIDNGLEPLTNPMIDREEARKRLCLPIDRPIFGSIGRFNPYKDHATMIRAFRELLRHRPKCHLVMAGLGIDSGNLTLGKMLKSDGLSAHVSLLGHLPDPANFYAGIDWLCMHSASEGFPNVVAEAMRAGRPCIVTDVGAAAHIVGDTGFVVPPGDEVQLSRALASAVDEPISAQHRRQQRASERWRSHFSIDAMWMAYRETYLSCLRENPSLQP